MATCRSDAGMTCYHLANDTVDRQTDRWTDRQTDKQTDRQTDRQTDGQTDHSIALCLPLPRGDITKHNKLGDTLQSFSATLTHLRVMFDCCVSDVKPDGTMRLIYPACMSIFTHHHKTVLQQLF